MEKNVVCYGELKFDNVPTVRDSGEFVEINRALWATLKIVCRKDKRSQSKYNIAAF